MEDILLEPVKAYTQVYDRAFEENAAAYFDELVKASGINVEENRATVSKYNRELSTVSSIREKLSRAKTGRGFLIALLVLGVIAAALGIYCVVTGANALWWIAVVLGVAAIVIPIVVIVKVIRPRIKQREQEIDKHTANAEQLQRQAYAQMEPLNALFESDATKKLIEKTVPKLVIDDNFDVRRYDYLATKYGFRDNDDLTSSTIDILSGEILGNPFVVDREVVETMGSKTYTGSLTIHWTTHYTDSEGHSQTDHHTQTLYASVEKPCPYYNTQTRLIYGNEAAPKLTFTHKPSHAEKMKESELNRHVKKQSKALRKLERKAMTDDDPTTNFTTMGNEEFDALFGATDRNDEVEFRLLFTPLAQKNMLELIKSKESFGDDFYFRKARCLNYVSSEHSARWDLDTDYHRYQSYDYDECRRKFIGFNRQYFKSLYFELAPLLSIPLYQQHKPQEYIYKTSYPRNYTSYEAECAVNKLGQNYFAPELAATQSILKSGWVSKEGATDEVQITAYAYVTEDRVDYVPTFGDDGFMHDVPVFWQEYIPVSKESRIKLKQLELSDKEFNAKRAQTELYETLSSSTRSYNYYRKLLCCLLSDGADNSPFDGKIDKAVK